MDTRSNIEKGAKEGARDVSLGIVNLHTIGLVDDFDNGDRAFARAYHDQVAEFFGVNPALSLYNGNNSHSYRWDPTEGILWRVPSLPDVWNMLLETRPREIAVVKFKFDPFPKASSWGKGEYIVQAMQEDPNVSKQLNFALRAESPQDAITKLGKTLRLTIGLDSIAGFDK